MLLSRPLEPEYLRALLGSFSKNFRPPTEGARRPANQLREFLRRVVGRTGLDEDMAFVVSEALVETPAERIARGESCRNRQDCQSTPGAERRRS